MKRRTSQRPPAPAELGRSNARHQHAEGEDPAGGAVAVGELEPGLVERLDHAGLPGDADPAARQHQRPLWFAGHEGQASSSMTAAIRPAAEASKAASASACLPNRFERTPHPTAIAAPILAANAHRSATLPAPVRFEAGSGLRRRATPRTRP